jgi:hypothetical protein
MALPKQPPDQSRLGITTWASEILVTDILASVAVIRRIGLTVDGKLILLSGHRTALNIDAAAVLQAHRSLQLMNQENVKFRYVT